MDTDYYRKLNKDLSTPFYNKATQERTAPGSTFKPVTAIAGLSEGVITDNDYIYCGGRFDKLQGAPLNCWLLSGHGALSIRDGIANSCNVFSVKPLIVLDRMQKEHLMIIQRCSS